MRIKNNRGFTLIESLIGLGIAGILLGGLMIMQRIAVKENKNLRLITEEAIDTSLAERVFFFDLNSMDPSFNNLTLKDDAGNLFFDYYPDIPLNALGHTKERSITLSLKGRKEMFFLLQDSNLGSMLNYDPVAAYNVGPAPDDFNTAASLEFISLNKGGWVQKQRPNFWTRGRLLMLDTPAHVRPLAADGSLDIRIPPRSPIFLGSVEGQDLRLDNTIRTLVNTTHPEKEIVIDSVDTFLRNLPSIGGGQSQVRMRAVRFVKYYLEEADNQRQGDGANLYKSIYNEGTWTEPFLISVGVDNLSFYRDSVLKRVIYFKINKVKD